MSGSGDGSSDSGLCIRALAECHVAKRGGNKVRVMVCAGRRTRRARGARWRRPTAWRAARRGASAAGRRAMARAAAAATTAAAALGMAGTARARAGATVARTASGSGRRSACAACCRRASPPCGPRACAQLCMGAVVSLSARRSYREQTGGATAGAAGGKFAPGHGMRWPGRVVATAPW